MATADEIRAITDPVQRIRAANRAIADATSLSSELAHITRDTVREMRRTMSYGEIAAALGISRGRVQQLAKER